MNGAVVEALIFVVLIVLIGCSTGVITSYFKSKKRVSPKVLARIERLEQQMCNGSLEERVRTLESIVTDEKRRLNREIRSL